MAQSTWVSICIGRRSLITRMEAAGEVVSEVRIANDPQVLSDEVAKAGSGARVVLEATYGWIGWSICCKA